MKVIKKNVYYCEHCNKRSLAAHAMATHEKHCTKNPGRECRLCGFGDIKDIVEQFKKRFILKEIEHDENESLEQYLDKGSDSHIVTWIGEPVTLKEIRASVEDCPNCILSILRQTGMNKHYFKLEAFDYKKESKWAFDEKVKENIYSRQDS